MLLHKQHASCRFARILLLIVAMGVAASQTAFEVASVKPSGTAGGLFKMTGGPGTADPTRISYTNIPLRRVLLEAYDFRNYQLLGPDWLNTLRFDITAKLSGPATKEQFQSMLRNLLITRFQMSTHTESRELPVYLLLPSKGGLKIKPAEAAAPTEKPPEELATVSPGEARDGFPTVTLRTPGIVIETRTGQARVTAKEVSMAKLADLLIGQVGRPVIDTTGLTANYTFELYFTPPGSNAGDGSEPGIFAALQEQLGLRLEASRKPVELLVIDRIEKVPTEN
jgi:uncharacterized protein (TIGR03435 family)